MFEETISPSDRTLGSLSRRLSALMPQGISPLRYSRRIPGTDRYSYLSWRQSQDIIMHTAGDCMTIKQKIMESSKDPPYLNGHKRSTSRISYLINPSPGRASSSSEDSARSPSPDGDVPYIDQPFRDGRRRKICHACNQPFGEREPVDICDGCCFERPAGCRDCNWTGWGRCVACRGHPADDDDGPHATAAIEGARPFATGFTRASFVGRGGDQHGPRTGSWGLRHMLGSTTT